MYSTSGSKNDHLNYLTMILQKDGNYKYSEIYTVRSSLRIILQQRLSENPETYNFIYTCYTMRSYLYLPKRIQ